MACGNDALAVVVTAPGLRSGKMAVPAAACTTSMSVVSRPATHKYDVLVGTRR